jgi:hypothetical protein
MMRRLGRHLEPYRRCTGFSVKCPVLAPDGSRLNVCPSREPQTFLEDRDRQYMTRCRLSMFGSGAVLERGLNLLATVLSHGPGVLSSIV